MATASAHMSLTRGCPISFDGDETSEVFYSLVLFPEKFPQSNEFFQSREWSQERGEIRGDIERPGRRRGEQ